MSSRRLPCGQRRRRSGLRVAWSILTAYIGEKKKWTGREVASCKVKVKVKVKVGAELNRFIVSDWSPGIWYIAQAQSLIRLSMGIVHRARGTPDLYGESVRGRSRHYGKPLC